MPGNDRCTKLLIHSNTTNGSTTFTDNSYLGSTITRTGNTQHLTNQFKMGTTSIYFDGVGDYLSIPSNSEFGIGAGEDFTIEFWYYANSPDDETELFNMTTAYDTDISNCKLKLLKDQAPSSNFIFDMNGGGSGRFVFGGNFSAQWNHLAIVREDGVVCAYLNGIKDMNTLSYNNDIAADNLFIGVGEHPEATIPTVRYWKGWIDEFRFSIGSARYTSNFTPPTEFFTPYEITHKVSGITNDMCKIVAINETDWQVDNHSCNVTTGSYGLYTTSGTKIIFAKRSDGEFIGYGGVETQSI